MEEWEMARWRSRARLHFLGTLHAPELEYRYLGGQKEIFENGVRILESLGMLAPQICGSRNSAKMEEHAIRTEGCGEDGQAQGRGLTRLGLRGVKGRSSAGSHFFLHSER
jgi:hypothetical protein